MQYIGVDYHKRYSYLVIKDEQGKMKRKSKCLSGFRSFSGV